MSHSMGGIPPLSPEAVAAMEAGLQSVVEAGLPFLTGLFISYVGWGCLLVQVPLYLLSSDKKTQPWIKWAVATIFLIVSLGVITNVQRTADTFSKHYGDRLWLADFHNLGATLPVTLYSAPVAVVLCQFLLTYRCYSFINSLHGGATVLRRVLGVLVTLLAFASFASGITSTHALLSYSDFGALAQDSAQGATLFEVTQGLWIGLSLFVDVILSVGVSLELLSALLYNRNDVGVGRNLQEVLRRLAVITIRNGFLLVAFQTAVLTAFLTSNPGWCSGAISALPCIQASCMMSYLNNPRQTARLQQTRAADEEEAVMEEVTNRRSTLLTQTSQSQSGSIAQTASASKHRGARRKFSNPVAPAGGKRRSSLMDFSSPGLPLGGKRLSWAAGETGTGRGRGSDGGGVRVETSFCTSVQVREEEEKSDENFGNSIWTEAPNAPGSHVRHLASRRSSRNSTPSITTDPSLPSAPSSRSPSRLSTTSRDRDREIGTFTGVVESRTAGPYDPDMPDIYELVFLSESNHLSNLTKT